MRRMRRLLLVLVILEALPIAARAADWTITAHGGASVPTGDLAEPDKGGARTGWLIGGTMDRLWNDRWSFGFDGAWNQNEGVEGSVVDLGGGDTRALGRARLTTWQLGAHATYYLPTRASMPVKWYALGGGGLYGLTERITETLTIGGTSTSTEATSTDKRAGLMFGIGGTWWPNAKVGFSAGVDYSIAFFDKDESSSSTLSFAGIHAGLTFSVPEPVEPSL